MDKIKVVKKWQSFTVIIDHGRLHDSAWQLDTGDLADGADINDIIEINVTEVWIIFDSSEFLTGCNN